MKKLLSVCSIVLFLGAQGVNAQNCDGYEIKLNQQVQRKAYTEAYPIFKEAIEKCADKKVSYYVFGEKILEELAQNAASEDERKKYAKEIVDLLQKRINLFPDDKTAYWEGERINYELNYDLKSREDIYKEYQALFNAATDAEKLSTSTVLNYYTTALQLLNDQKIQFDEALEVYFKTKEVTEKNIELRSVEYGKLAEKLDSLQSLEPAKKLSSEEEQKMENVQKAKSSFLEIQDNMESILAQFTTCENLSPMYIEKFKTNRDSIDWLISAYQQLSSRDCYDLPIMETIEKQYAYLWQKEHPQEAAPPAQGNSGGLGSNYAKAAKAFGQKNYSSAISLFQKALGEVEGTKKGDVAYFIAAAYQKTGNLNSAVSWAKKAANYKPGYGAPYELIAGIFGSNANSCGKNTFDKLVAYWVAADYANKACAVDSRSCGRARRAASSYNANGPSLEMSFQQGKKKGDRVSISCFGGATTRVR